MIQLYYEHYPAMTTPDTVRLKDGVYEALIQDGLLIMQNVPFDHGRWDEFIEKLLAIDVAKWKRRYDDRSVCDGLCWALLVADPRLHIHAVGINAYPGPEGEPLTCGDREATKQYDLVRAAVINLVL